MLSDLRNIPRIMRKYKWAKGAALLDRWFAAGVAVAPRYGPADTTTITMGWLLKFPRAKQLFDALVADRIWANPAARGEIAAMLRRRHLLGPGGVSFGNLSAPVPVLDADYINQRTHSESPLDFDDLTAALGAFSLRVVVGGTVAPERKTGRHRVTLTAAGVYVRDSFDFQGNQYLGCWGDDPDLFMPVMPPQPAFSFTPPPVRPVGNRDFREWRARNGRGGDFLVFSDLRVIRLSGLDTFLI